MKLFPKTDYQFLVDKYFRKELFYVHCIKNEVFQYGFLKSMWQNRQFPVDLVTFIEEICNRKTSFFVQWQDPECTYVIHDQCHQLSFINLFAIHSRFCPCRSIFSIYPTSLKSITFPQILLKSTMMFGKYLVK